MKTTSILINNYNNGRYIADCVNSALNQTVPADEVIVYDDGSTDESLSILRAYGNRIVLIEGVHDERCHSRENQANAVYRALVRSNGEWLFLLDGDDLFTPEKVAIALQALNNNKAVSLLQSPMNLIDEHGRRIGRYRDARFHHPNVIDVIYKENDVDYFYPTSALVVSRSSLTRILPLDMRVCPELACDTRIGMLTSLLGRVITLEETLACWRRHSRSYIAALARSRWFAAQQTMRRIRTFNNAVEAFAAPKISIWQNRRFRRQLAGGLLPKSFRRHLRDTATIFQGTSVRPLVK